MAIGIASLLTTSAGYVGDIKDFENMYAEAMGKGILNADDIRAYAGTYSDEMYQAMRDAWDRYTGDMDFNQFADNFFKTHYTNQRAENPSTAFIEGAKLGNDFVYFEDWIDSYQRMLSFANSAEGLQKFYDAVNGQLSGGGKIDENFLKNFFNDNNLEMRGGYGQAMVEMMMSNMFGEGYSRPGYYFGDFADDSISSFIKSHINDTLDWSQFGTVAQVLAALNGILNNMEYVPNSNSVYRNVTTGEQYQLTDDGRLVALNDAAGALKTAADNMTITARELATQLITSGAIDILSLGKGLLSTEEAINYLTSQLTGNTGKYDNPLKFTDPLGTLTSNNTALGNIEYVPNSNSVYRNVTTGEQYQLTDDGRLVALNDAAGALKTAADNMTITARELATQLITSGAIDILSLGKGLLSTEEAINYLTSQLTGNTGKYDNPLKFTDPLGTLTSNNTALGNIEYDLDTLIAMAANNITDEGLRSAFLAGMSNYEGVLNGTVDGLNRNVISLQDAVATLSKSPGWVLELGQGPLSSEGAYNYVMQQLASGSAANSQLLQSIQNGISALDPSLTVDITNSAPIVNVDVNVKVDSTGRVISKQVLQGFGNIDNWWYRSSQRYGTTKRIER